MSSSRFFGDGLARNSRTSAAVGSTPMVSRKARRMNSESLQRGEGGTFSDFNFSFTSSSMKLRFGALVKAVEASLLSNGTVTVASARRLRNHAEIAPSPRPITVMRPSSLTMQTALFALVNFA